MWRLGLWTRQRRLFRPISTPSFSHDFHTCRVAEGIPKPHGTRSRNTLTDHRTRNNTEAKSATASPQNPLIKTAHQNRSQPQSVRPPRRPSCDQARDYPTKPYAVPADPSDVSAASGFGDVALCYPGDEAHPHYPGPSASRNRVYWSGKFGGKTKYHWSRSEGIPTPLPLRDEEELYAPVGLSRL